MILEEIQRGIYYQLRGIDISKAFCCIICFAIGAIFVMWLLSPAGNISHDMPYEEDDDLKHYITFSPEDMKKMKAMKQTPPSLDVDGKFLTLSGHRFRILSGSIHYFRIVPEYWRDRLQKLKAAGLNTVDTYIPWNLHEEIKGIYNFTGILDLRRFIQTAADVGLYVILRPGPYICAEWDLGGLPSWLLREKGMKLRTRNTDYQRAFIEFFKRVVPKFNDLQYNQGGPIIMVQVENEMGSYGDDTLHMTYVLQTLQALGISEQLFISENSAGLGRIILPGVYMAINFGPQDDVDSAFDKIKELQPKNPVFVAEFWSGWFDHWGEQYHNARGVEPFKKTLEMILRSGASVNFYMFHGGTNFGFLNGANQFGTLNKYQPTITSYDYDAPLTEHGAVTEKYKVLQKLIAELVPKSERLPYRGDKSIPKVLETPKTAAYGEVSMKYCMQLSSMLSQIEVIDLDIPTSMEMLPINHKSGQAFGYILYRHLKYPGSTFFAQAGIRDRAQFLVDGKQLAVCDWTLDEAKPIELQGAPSSEFVLDVLVENMGRVNYAQGSNIMNEQRKGILGTVLCGKQEVTKWQAFVLDFKPSFMSTINKSRIGWVRVSDAIRGPTLFRGHFDVKSDPTDTFLLLKGWNKGVAFVNGNNLGRYWKLGPTKTLYVPAPWLKTGTNEVIIFEEEPSATAKTVEFVDRPSLGPIEKEDT